MTGRLLVIPVGSDMRPWMEMEMEGEEKGTQKTGLSPRKHFKATCTRLSRGAAAAFLSFANTGKLYCHTSYFSPTITTLTILRQTRAFTLSSDLQPHAHSPA